MFLPHKSDNGAVLPWEYMAAAAGTYKAGQLVTVTSGQIAPIAAAQDTTPPYLSMADVTLADGEQLPVTRISHDWIYMSALSADTATAAVGAKLQVAAGGLQVAAGDGTFEIVNLDGTTAGDAVYGRWV